jgi:hypothetical protein
MILGVAVDVTVFKNLSPHYFQILGSDPIFTAFLVTMLQLLKDIPPQNHFSFICDDEEEAAIHMFKLYRRVKLIVPGARDTLAAISFADDRFLFGLQAADIVSSSCVRKLGRSSSVLTMTSRLFFWRYLKNPNHTRTSAHWI